MNLQKSFSSSRVRAPGTDAFSRRRARPPPTFCAGGRGLLGDIFADRNTTSLCGSRTVLRFAVSSHADNQRNTTTCFLRFSVAWFQQ